MIYKASSLDIERMLLLPETGMGYQIIDAKIIGSSELKRYAVYNSELIIDYDQKFPDFKKIVIKTEYPNILNTAETLSFVTNSITVVDRKNIIESRYMTESIRFGKHRYSGGNGAKDNPREPAGGKEVFVRISAYEDDKRIDFVNKKLKPGTYTTTFKDYWDCVSYNDDPIDRYALPNEETIKWAFYVLPKFGDILQRGIVQPAFGHVGGGIEAYFEDGTSLNTYYEKRPYGK